LQIRTVVSTGSTAIAPRDYTRVSGLWSQRVGHALDKNQNAVLD